MRYFYYAVLLSVAIFFIYFTGINIGKAKCVAQIANANVEQIVSNTKLMDKANEVVLHTGTNAVRRVLREKYTIAE